MKTETKLALAGVALATATTSVVALAVAVTLRIDSIRRAPERRAAALVQQFKACPEMYRSGCAEASAARIMAATAEAQERSGNFMKAGMCYARLGNHERADAMADSLYRRRLTEPADSLIVENGIWERARQQYMGTSPAQLLRIPKPPSSRPQ